MQSDTDANSSVDLESASNCLELMLLEYPDVRINTFGELLRLTNSAEREYSQICQRRYMAV